MYCSIYNNKGRAPFPMTSVYKCTNRVNHAVTQCTFELTHTHTHIYIYSRGERERGRGGDYIIY